MKPNEELIQLIDDDIKAAFHKDLQPYLSQLSDISFELLDGKDPTRPAFIDQLMQENIPGIVYRFPYLSQLACELVGRLNEVHEAYPNPDEHYSNQMDEITLTDRDWPVVERLLQIYNIGVIPFMYFAFGLAPYYVSSVQTATYYAEGRGTSMTSFHVDDDSELTTTVELSVDTFKRGGGLEIYGHPVIPTTPQGWASIFPGKTYMHEAKPIQSGIRQILVHWHNYSERHPEGGGVTYD